MTSNASDLRLGNLIVAAEKTDTKIAGACAEYINHKALRWALEDEMVGLDEQAFREYPNPQKEITINRLAGGVSVPMAMTRAEISQLSLPGDEELKSKRLAILTIYKRACSVIRKRCGIPALSKKIETVSQSEDMSMRRLIRLKSSSLAGIAVKLALAETLDSEDVSSGKLLASALRDSIALIGQSERSKRAA